MLYIHAKVLSLALENIWRRYHRLEEFECSKAELEDLLIARRALQLNSDIQEIPPYDNTPHDDNQKQQSECAANIAVRSLVDNVDFPSSLLTKVALSRVELTVTIVLSRWVRNQI